MGIHMLARDFCYWLMGSLELVEPTDGLNEKQTKVLKNHLDMVFIHMVNKDGSLKPEPTKVLGPFPIETYPWGRHSDPTLTGVPEIDTTKTTGYHESPQLNC